MLHLFNKTYLELDDKIELHFDRVVISNENGFNIAEFLANATQGKLIKYGRNLEDFNFFNLISEVDSFGQLSNKKILIYCDKNNYIKFLIKWFKTILPNIDLNSFNRLVNLTVYKERIINNTQMQSVKPVKMDVLWEGLGNLTEKFNSEIISEDNRNFIKNLSLRYSYEFLLADYFSNLNNFNNNYFNLLKTTVHLFLKRWFQELFKDNREMILFNVLNKNFQTALNFNEDDLNLNSVNPLSSIPSLKYYADETIWIQENILSNNFQICNLNNLSQTQIDGIRNLFKKVFDEIEEIQIDNGVFQVLNFLEYACKESITTEELNNVLNFVVENPFDTCLIPKYDFQNVNYVFLHHLLNLKRDNSIEALTKFRLL